ncbi:hypothetical protein [Amycolatopsis sp. GM8]|uniref:hypothetical protein n=1 Tax=Amycolatopsis sp. GM8 TaxID=2896530 RepID=UPI001F27CD7C|nr:hypothetical protein [Amycolatopsis sp. GM8]
MNETSDLPERRPMPEGLRDRLWDELEPQLETRGSGGRFRTMRAPLAVAASVVVLAAGVAIALPQLRGHGNGDAVIAVAGSPGDVQLVNECIQADHNELPPAQNWRAGARIDIDAENGFLAVRNDKYAVVCVLKNGNSTGLIQGTNTRDAYNALTAARPFDYLAPWNWNYPATESVHFGIATSDVIAVSIVGPDKSVTPAILRDGTFLAKTKFAQNSGQPTTSLIRVTLKNGQVIEGPSR